MPLPVGRLDLLGILSSSVCLLHCVLLPLLLSGFPVLAPGVSEHPALEAGTLVLSAAAGGWSFYRSYHRLHRNKWILVLFLCGLASLLLASLVESGLGEGLLKLVGAGLLITAHLRNGLACRACQSCKKQNH